jgi:hypothetical protein
MCAPSLLFSLLSCLSKNANNENWRRCSIRSFEKAHRGVCFEESTEGWEVLTDDDRTFRASSLQLPLTASTGKYQVDMPPRKISYKKEEFLSKQQAFSSRFVWSKKAGHSPRLGCLGGCKTNHDLTP